MPDHTTQLRQLIEKQLLHRGHRGATCRVFPPAGGMRSYSAILEEAGIREQFFIEARQVELFAQTGNEQWVLNEIRTAVRNLDRLINKKKATRH